MQACMFICMHAYTHISVHAGMNVHVTLKYMYVSKDVFICLNVTDHARIRKFVKCVFWACVFVRIFIV